MLKKPLNYAIFKYLQGRIILLVIMLAISWVETHESEVIMK